MYRANTRMRLEMARRLFRWMPHRTQRRFLLDSSKNKVAACGRRWGKTEACAVDAATMAVANPGSVQMIVSPTYDQSRLIFDKVERLILCCPLLRRRARVLRTPYPRLTVLGSRISVRTADEDGRNLRGHSADRVILDEAAFIRDSVVAEVISPMLADRNGSLVMVSTPFGKNHFYRAYLRGQEPCSGVASFRFPSWDNPHISAEYVERQRQQLSRRQFSVEYEAEFTDDVSGVFAWEDINQAVERDSGLDADGAIVAGIDWARYSDYTAVVTARTDGNTVVVKSIDRFNGLSWRTQLERVTQLLTRDKVSLALCDQTSIGDPLLEQLSAKLYERQAPCRAEGYTFTNLSKRELIDRLAMMFSHGLISIPRNEALIDELTHFEFELTGAGNVRMNAREGYHDDLVIALALAVRAACGQAPGAGASSGGSRRSENDW